MGLIPRQPTVEELGWGNSPFPIPAFSLQPFAFSLFLIIQCMLIVILNYQFWAVVPMFNYECRKLVVE